MNADEVARAAATALWAGDRASRWLGMQLVEVGPGRAVLRMPVREEMTNGHGTGHGGLTFTLADSAFAFACNSYGTATVAAAAEIRFLRPVHGPAHGGAELVATAVERWREPPEGLYDVTVTQGGVTVARFVGHSHEVGGPIAGADQG